MPCCANILRAIFLDEFKATTLRTPVPERPGCPIPADLTAVRDIRRYLSNFDKPLTLVVTGPRYDVRSVATHGDHRSILLQPEEFWPLTLLKASHSWSRR
jgi:hypothetical protein